MDIGMPQRLFALTELKVPMIAKSHAGTKIGELIIDTYDI
jgi:hypothetical protein